MKTYRTFAIAFIALFCAFTVSAQTADEIISNYVQAIGGKNVLSKLTSVYYEGIMDVMGMQIGLKNTILNGKGMKQEMNMMDSPMITCYNDKGGWSINPFTGSGSAEDMTADQYNAGKYNIFIGAPFVNYPENGYKAELAGNEPVADVNAYKIIFTTPEKVISTHYFDPNTFLLLKSIEQADMQGQMVDNAMTFSDYRGAEGYKMPYKIDMDMAGGQFLMTLTVNKVEVNVPVDDSLFVKPQ
jgi:hypothetical protein